MSNPWTQAQVLFASPEMSACVVRPGRLIEPTERGAKSPNPLIAIASWLSLPGSNCGMHERSMASRRRGICRMDAICFSHEKRPWQHTAGTLLRRETRRGKIGNVCGYRSARGRCSGTTAHGPPATKATWSQSSHPQSPVTRRGVW